MGTLKEADEILVEFLRSELIEPERYIYNKTTNVVSRFTKRHKTAIDTFVGDGSTSRFTLSKTKLLCVRSVAIAGVTIVKYQGYNIDLENNQVIGIIALPSGTTMTVEYDYNATGTSWIFPDKPREDLDISSFPRIAVVSLTESGDPMGLFEIDFLQDLTFQVDSLTKKNLFLEFYGGETTQTVDIGAGGISDADITIR